MRQALHKIVASLRGIRSTKSLSQSCFAVYPQIRVYQVITGWH